MEDLSWVPPTCIGGHRLGPGRMSLSWIGCDCEHSGPSDTGGGRGHHVVFCLRHCRPERRPPGCMAELDQAPGAVRL